MRYRACHNVLALAGYVTVFGFLIVAVASMFQAFVDQDLAAILVRGAVFAAVMGAIAASAQYWPTKRRPARLYHVTTKPVVEAATVEVHNDGTRTLALRGKSPGRPVYFFDRWPRRGSVQYNVKTIPDACIELVDVDYDGIVVRRRWTGAYHLSGLVHARARIHPLPWDFDRRRRNEHRRPRRSAPR